MTSVNTQQTNFTSGELSPSLYGRSDLQAYFNGARRIENWFVNVAGSVRYREGFTYVAQTANNNKAFLYSFQYSNIQAYMLEFTEGNIRIYRDRGVVTSGGSPVDVVTPYLENELFELKLAQNAKDLYIVHPRHNPRKLTRSSDSSWTLSLHSPTGFSPSFATQAITNITQADPAVLTYGGADNFADGDVVLIDSVVGMTEVNGNYYVVTNVNTGANTFELYDENGNSIDSTGFTAYSSGGAIQNSEYFPSAVTFYEERLIYGGTGADPETLWFSKSADFDDFTVGTGATDGIKYTIAAGEGANNIEWLRGTQDFLVIGGQDDLVKATGGEGQTAIAPNQISIKPTNTYGVLDINPVSRDQFVAFVQRNGLTFRTFENIALEGIYRPIDRTLIAEHVTRSGITQIAYQDGIPNLIWCVRNDGNLACLTFERDQEVVAWHRHTTQGDFTSVATTSRINNYDDVWACVKRDGNYYIEYLNDRPTFPQFEDFVGDDEEADRGTFNRAMQEYQKQYIHLDSALTYDGTDTGVNASASLTTAALSGSSVTFTASAAVFSASDVGRELRVKSLDGTSYGRAVITAYNSTTMVVCEITVPFDKLTYSSGDWYITADEVTGLSHLEGKTVGVIVDGAVHPDAVVSSGAVSLQSQASVVHVGLKYTGTVETNDLEGGGTTGTAQTKKKSVYQVGARLNQTSGLEFGTNYYKMETRLVREALDDMDNPPPLKTEDERIKMTGQKSNSGWSYNQRVIFRQKYALPAEVQMLVPYFNVSNG